MLIWMQTALRSTSKQSLDTIRYQVWSCGQGQGFLAAKGAKASRQRALEFKTGQVQKEKVKKMILVHLKFFHLRVCVFFLEGEAWTAEVHANILQQHRNAVKSVTHCVCYIMKCFPALQVWMRAWMAVCLCGPAINWQLVRWQQGLAPVPPSTPPVTEKRWQ